jgi:hypothetical protein
MEMVFDSTTPPSSRPTPPSERSRPERRIGAAIRDLDMGAALLE